MFNDQTGTVRQRFIKDLDGVYFRLDKVQKLWIYTDLAEYQDVHDDGHHTHFVVIAKLEDDHEEVSLFFSPDENEAKKWMDDLVKKLNGLAD